MILLAFIGFCFGMAVGIPVTEGLYLGNGWPRDFWTRRLTGRFIRANFPVGMVLFGSITLWAPNPETRWFWGGVAVGMGVAAVSRAFYGDQPED